MYVTDNPISGRKVNFQSHMGPVNFRLVKLYHWRKSTSEMTTVDFSSVTMWFSYYIYTTKPMLGM